MEEEEEEAEAAAMEVVVVAEEMTMLGHLEEGAWRLPSQELNSGKYQR